MKGDLEAARGDGRLANDDAVASAVASIVTGGPAEGMRALDIRTWGGVDLRLLPDRGLDIGAAWFRGTPLNWVSTVGETAPLESLDGYDWSDAFGGGLLVTCGLRNVGRPSEGHGLHGTFSHLPASSVEVSRMMDRTPPSIEVTGVIRDDDDPPLEVERSITSYLGVGRVEITDRVTNHGSTVAESPLLYHFNFGYPLWGPGGSLSIDVVDTIPRDSVSEAILDSWARPPQVNDVEERVVEHVVNPDDGWGAATVTNVDLGVSVTVRWRTAELPRLHQWIDPSPGMYVLGVEPANCSTEGRAHDRAEGRLPVLEPGETCESRILLEVA